MFENLSNDYKLISPTSVEEFVNDNEMAEEIIAAMDPHLNQFFPNAEFSLEVSNKIKWTTETKLLLNVAVSEEVFFNGMLDNLNEVYAEVEPLIDDILCPVVLFPQIKNKSFDKMANNSAINLIARTAYFNNDYGGTIEREIGLRDIPRDQKKQEIMEYCDNHDDIFAPDIEEELQIDFHDVCDILDELEKEGKIHEIR
jgi:hypothetical protein